MHIPHLTLLAVLLALVTLTSTLQLSASLTPTTSLSKRLPSPRGGGGRGGFGGGGTRSGGGISRPPPSTRGGSNIGGRTASGSGVPPSYAGFYAGGARVPYRSGAVLPGRGIAPLLLVGGGLGFWAGTSWGAHGAYAYEFPANVTFRNATTGKRETLPAVCLCSRYAECSCAVNGGQRYVRAVLGDGSAGYLSAHEQTVQIAEVNGTRTIVLNGTLANGTTASGAAGGGRRALLESTVWAAGAVAVGWAVWAL